MLRLSSAELGVALIETIRDITRRGEHAIVGSDEGDIAVVVSVEEYRAMLDLEEQLDADAFLKAKQEFEASGEESIPYEVIRKDLGLA